MNKTTNPKEQKKSQIINLIEDLLLTETLEMHVHDKEWYALKHYTNVGKIPTNVRLEGNINGIPVLLEILQIQYVKEYEILFKKPNPAVITVTNPTFDLIWDKIMSKFQKLLDDKTQKTTLEKLLEQFN